MLAPRDGMRVPVAKILDAIPNEAPVAVPIEMSVEVPAEDLADVLVQPRYVERHHVGRHRVD